jgi:predicted DNA-binding WGR domain protein
MEIVALESVCPAENRFRFYVLSIDETLFGDVALVREWGRIGTNGRRRLDLFDDRVRAFSSLEEWLERKRRRGYEVVESSLPISPRQISPRPPAQIGASASIGQHRPC